MRKAAILGNLGMILLAIVVIWNCIDISRLQTNLLPVILEHELRIECPAEPNSPYTGLEIVLEKGTKIYYRKEAK